MRIIQEKIFEIRGERIMLDFDLAVLYGVKTKRLNEQVKRNLSRFPADFMFILTEDEWKMIQEQFIYRELPNWSQIATSSVKHRRKYFLPFAFTEHGVTMLASVLHSETAIAASIVIVRAFINLRHLASQYKELAEKLAQLEENNEEQFREINEVLNYLVNRKQEEDDYLKTGQGSGSTNRASASTLVS